MGETREPILDVRGLEIRFGGVVAAEGFEVQVFAHEIVGLIGPNGAGKTSIINGITGFYKAQSGEVRIAGQNILGRRPHIISRLGVRRTFQNLRLFGQLTVFDNIASGIRVEHHVAADELETQIHDLCRLLEIPAVELNRATQELPYGLQRRVELARALIANPRIMLVDEPGAGLNSDEKRTVVQAMRRAVAEREMGAVLIEHDMGMITQACDRVVVLDHGRLIAVGTAEEVRQNPDVIAAYIGTEE